MHIEPVMELGFGNPCLNVFVSIYFLSIFVFLLEIGKLVGLHVEAVMLKYKQVETVTELRFVKSFI